MYGPTSAPPPTPSSQPNTHLATPSTTDAAADVLSRLLHRLPPTLSLPTRFSSPATCPHPPPPLPLISLFDQALPLSSFAQLGAFQLTDHGLSSQLASSAESDSLALFKLTEEEKKKYFPKNWPLGYGDGDDEEARDQETGRESFCLDSTCSTESKELSLGSLREFARALEEVGLKIVELLANAAGFENPIGNDPTQFPSLVWVTKGLHDEEEPVTSGGFYPYVVGLQYQIKKRKYLLLADSGQVTVAPQVDSVLVTIGDIAQVWSNGKVNKVRGRAIACLGDQELDINDSHCISMTLLVTLPTKAMVSPLIPELGIDNNDDDNQNEEKDDEEKYDESSSRFSTKRSVRLFRSFLFEDYAWRVFHEQLIIKDPLDRYRI